MHQIAFTRLGAVPESVGSARQTQRAESARTNSTAMANRDLNDESRGIAIPEDCEQTESRFQRGPSPRRGAWRHAPCTRDNEKRYKVTAPRPPRDPLAGKSGAPAIAVPAFTIPSSSAGISSAARLLRSRGVVPQKACAKGLSRCAFVAGIPCPRRTLLDAA